MGAPSSFTTLAALYALWISSGQPSSCQQSDNPAEPCPAAEEVEARIRFYTDQAANQSRPYPTLALLGRARLDRARWNSDPRDLAAARDALQRSIDIQPNLAAYKNLAGVANYSHRFEDALRWCELAAGASPADPEILAMRTEALLALDRPEQVNALLAGIDEDSSFYLLACRGMKTAAGSQPLDALPNFEAAAQVADKLAFVEQSIWARVASAALYLDSGRPAQAEPYLRTAEEIDPGNYDLQVHLAEFEVASGRKAEALARYERLLALRCDPEVHRRAFILSKTLHCKRDAERHYDAAERLWRAAFDHGEIYPLEGLANLYCDADRNLDEALRLAGRNLEFKRDRSARETHRRAQVAQDQL